MRIGIDARFLTHPQAGGFKTYTNNLVRGLMEVDDENHYVIYVDRPFEPGSLPTSSNFTYSVIEGRVPGLEMPLREQLFLRRAIKRDDLDLVHFLCNTAPVNLEIDVILTLHDTIQVTIDNRFRLARSVSQQKAWAITAYSKWTILRSIQNAAQVVTVSNFEKESISKQFEIPRERISVTHLAPDSVFERVNPTTREEWRRELNALYGVPDTFILGVGYEPRKNIPLLIQAFSHVAARFPALNLVLVAANEARRSAFVQQARALELADRILVLGKQSAQQLAMLYNLSTLFVYPSERESFGLPPLEAMACGAPTIATNGSSLPEILAGGAFMVDGSAENTWVEVISRFVQSEADRNDLIERGLRRAAELTWSHCAEQTLTVYRSVASRNLPEAVNR